MTIKGTIVSIAMIIALMVFAASQSKAQQEPELPVLPAPPQVEEQPLPPTVYRINRDVPCTDFEYVKSLLEIRGQVPLAQGQALDPNEVMSRMVLTYNDQNGQFSIIIVNEDLTVACNIYSGLYFQPLAP
jgi:hypothetical protein|tara:strand:- start:10 stop:399 length:390 start_codon:yes stop_codon:yes gene_type:complete